ncbi:MAG TPA: serine/threonine-protein kinase, partial [Kofleriaceae bacterium]
MGDLDRDLRGRRLGEFVIGERIGQGSHGVVYVAEQVGLGREAVVKIARGGREVDRFLAEAQIASRLDHPYAAHVYAFGAEADGLRWIAMERVRGSTLAAMIAAHGALPLDRFVVLFERLCEVVHDVHEHGIVHRDIKPENVMVVSKAGRQLPKLLDLGVATLAGHGDDRRIGSPRYMAPEQWVRGGELDRRSDLYGLGVLAYEALTGRPPFAATEIAELARAHARAAVPPVGDGLPPELDGFFGAALAKDRAAR